MTFKLGKKNLNLKSCPELFNWFLLFLFYTLRIISILIERIPRGSASGVGKQLGSKGCLAFLFYFFGNAKSKIQLISE